MLGRAVPLHCIAAPTSLPEKGNLSSGLCAVPLHCAAVRYPLPDKEDERWAVLSHCIVLLNGPLCLETSAAIACIAH